MQYLMGQDPQQTFFRGANRGTIRLNRKTPFGLFVSSRGNKYIITEDFETKIAIVLEHSKIPQFSWIGLGKASVDSGNWQGPFWLSETHAARDQEAPMSPGSLEIGDGFAELDCVGSDGEINSINLGYAGPRGSYFCDYDGWAIYTLTADSPFFVKSPAD